MRISEPTVFFPPPVSDLWIDQSKSGDRMSPAGVPDNRPATDSKPLMATGNYYRKASC